MKHLKFFAAAAMFSGIAANAQDSNNTWAISFGANAIDTKVSAEANNKPQFILFDAKKNWNLLPSVSYIDVAKYVGNGLSFGVTGSINRINRWSDRIIGTDSDLVTNPGNLAFYGIDGTVRYSFQELINVKAIDWLDPSLNVGGGYNFFGKASGATLNAGFGLTFWFSEQVGFQWKTIYKHSFDENRVPNLDVPSHFQHLAGLSFKFGGKDTDGDGIYDKDDACPTEFGLAEFNGCPDSDGDGIPDKDDKCPDVAGPQENGGCPWPDTDGDGVLDKDDACPTVKGTVANKGCPEVTEEAIKKLNDYAKTILFDSAKATFQKQTYSVLEAITNILKEYPASKFSIEGHTDSDGKADKNLILSKERANAVKAYLTEHGIASDRLTSEGFGSTRPIDTNKTKAGKANNRRVEVKLVK